MPTTSMYLTPATPNDDGTWSQAVIDDIAACLKSPKILSKGGSGTAIRCVYSVDGGPAVPVVAKVPNALATAVMETMSAAPKKSFMGRRHASKPSSQVVAIFTREARMAQRLTEGKTWRKLYPAGTALLNTDDEVYTAMQLERNAMRQHPGFSYIHQLMHFDPTIPLILSTPCDGTTLDLLNHANWPIRKQDGQASDLWLCRAYGPGVKELLKNQLLKQIHTVYK